MIDVLVIGGGPAGVIAALRAADLGANTLYESELSFHSEGAEEL